MTADAARDEVAVEPWMLACTTELAERGFFNIPDGYDHRIFASAIARHAAASPPSLLALVREWAEASSADILHRSYVLHGSTPEYEAASKREAAAVAALRRAAGGGAP